MKYIFNNTFKNIFKIIILMNDSDYTQKQRLSIIMDIMMKLKNFKLNNGQIIDLYNQNNSFINELKIISNLYIKDGKTSKGFLDFIEIGKKIEYHFPQKNYRKPLFVIRNSIEIEK